MAQRCAFPRKHIYNTFQPKVYDIVDFRGASVIVLLLQRHLHTAHTVLPPEEVKAEMRRVMDVLPIDGGYILAPDHAMPSDIPQEMCWPSWLQPRMKNRGGDTRIREKLAVMA